MCCGLCWDPLVYGIRHVESLLEEVRLSDSTHGLQAWAR